ncbi:hypothetical protein [Dokdonella soli]|uniref:hypothetical protein n=1 Tax=Dokdonella soli TaxID=529810 RepID=UPI0031D97987
MQFQRVIVGRMSGGQQSGLGEIQGGLCIRASQRIGNRHALREAVSAHVSRCKSLHAFVKGQSIRFGELAAHRKNIQSRLQYCSAMSITISHLIEQRRAETCRLCVVTRTQGLVDPVHARIQRNRIGPARPRADDQQRGEYRWVQATDEHDD